MSTRNILDIPAKLMGLKEHFTQRGFELWFVGGAVRDSLLGITPKDIDLATSATPEEAIALYREHDYSFHETGMAHGTITVVLDHVPYEITTYRIDAETDGRHATVVYTRDLSEDLLRRDLTMNAIAMGFDGEIFDPFGGVADIEESRIRFVGDAEQRLREDYLRILRWFRFYGRFATASTIPDNQAWSAIEASRDGLKQISVERIWSEISKIIAGPEAEMVLGMIADTGVGEVIGLPVGSSHALKRARLFNRNPAFLLASLIGSDVTKVAQKWKWSNDERQTARFVIERDPATYDLARAKRDVYEKWSKELVGSMLRIADRAAEAALIDAWVIPTFPVTGEDLIQRGMTPGPVMGGMIKAMKDRWIKSDYALSKADMLNA
jgi:tRNA nucleotidyltransferase (CCA-adding enzyme)